MAQRHSNAVRLWHARMITFPKVYESKESRILYTVTLEVTIVSNNVRLLLMTIIDKASKLEI